MRLIAILVAGLSCIGTQSCKKELEIEAPKDRLVQSSVFLDDNSATAAITGIYSDMMQTEKFMSSNQPLLSGLAADEITFPGTSNSSWPQFETTNILVDNPDISSAWSQAYMYIYDANAAIENIPSSPGISTVNKNQLMGEAKFIRALTYFYLINWFGDVPKITTTDYAVNSVLPRSPQADIYNLIISDLKDAQTLLNNTYPTTERVRPNRLTATALLSRVYLYTKDYANAEIQSSLVINSGLYTLPPTLTDVFLKASNETIWQLMPVNSSYNTILGFRLVASSTTARPTLCITNNLVSSFEAGDLRRNAWVASSVASGITYYSASKYKIKSGGTPLNEYYVAFRLAEQYLIRAESRAQLNTNLGGAITDINTIRSRAGLPGISSTITQGQCLTAIEKERRIELFTEWGHRWLDLRRTNRAEAVLSAYKPATWKSTALLFPIPLTEINANSLLTQNPGY